MWGEGNILVLNKIKLSGAGKSVDNNFDYSHLK